MVCASPSSVLWARASKPSEWNHESHETHEKEDRGTASDSLAERVRHPTPRNVLHHDTLPFRVFRAFRGGIPACVVGETATDERDAHTSQRSLDEVTRGGRGSLRCIATTRP